MLFALAGLFFFASVLMMRRLTGLGLRRWTIPSAFWWTYTAMIFVPSFFVYADHPHPAREHFLFAVISVLLTVPLGIYAMNVIARYRKSEARKFWDAPVQETTVDTSVAIIYGFLLVSAVLVFFLYLREVKTIPFLYMIKNPGNYQEIVGLREQAFKLLDSPLSYVYFVFRVLMFPVLILLSLGYYLYSRRAEWLLLFFVALGFGLSFAAVSAAKMPVAAIILLVFLFAYFYKGGRIPKKYYAFSLILLLGWPLYVIFSFQAGMGVTALLGFRAIAWRLLYYPAEDIYYYFEYFPHVHDYLFGRSIGKLSALLGWNYFDTPNIVGQYAHPEFPTTINMNAGFLGDLNADFGLVGVLFGGFLVGLIIQAVHIYFVRRNKTVITMVLYVFMTFAFWLLHSMSLPVVLMSNGVLFAFLLVFLWRAAGKFLRRSAARAGPG